MSSLFKQSTTLQNQLTKRSQAFGKLQQQMSRQSLINLFKQSTAITTISKQGQAQSKMLRFETETISKPILTMTTVPIMPPTVPIIPGGGGLLDIPEPPIFGGFDSGKKPGRTRSKQKRIKLGINASKLLARALGFDLEKKRKKRRR